LKLNANEYYRDEFIKEFAGEYRKAYVVMGFDEYDADNAWMDSFHYVVWHPETLRTDVYVDRNTVEIYDGRWDGTVC
jgi:antibiotic biosynthesis monooxygenase (ABM) superfamily enzyme